MDLISPDDLDDSQLDHLIGEANRWFDRNRTGAAQHDRLSGHSVVLAFFENSTRTLLSFDMAARRMGAMVTVLPVEASSIAKGESLKDTVRTIDAMRPDIFVLRHPEEGAAREVAGWMEAAVVNAGDGTGQHPTQGLLDVATIHRHFGRVEGLKVAICGDIRHSRVAGSTRKLLQRLGADVRIGGPASLLPDGSEDGIDHAIAGADVVMMLRVQRERMADDLGDEPGEYLARYGLTQDRLKDAARDAVVMHPGPMNRGVEIEDAVADGPQSLVLTQVEMGVAMRMAVLDLMIEDRRA